MVPAPINLTITRGDSLDFLMRLKVTGSVPAEYIDLTGYVGKCQIRSNADDATVLAEATVTIADQTAFRGRVVVSFTPVQTAALPSGNMVYDVQLTSPTGNVSTYVGGTVTLNKDVTKP